MFSSQRMGTHVTNKLDDHSFSHYLDPNQSTNSGIVSSHVSYQKPNNVDFGSHLVKQERHLPINASVQAVEPVFQSNQITPSDNGLFSSHPVTAQQSINNSKATSTYTQPMDVYTKPQMWNNESYSTTLTAQQKPHISSNLASTSASHNVPSSTNTVQTSLLSELDNTIFGSMNSTEPAYQFNQNQHSDNIVFSSRSITMQQPEPDPNVTVYYSAQLVHPFNQNQPPNNVYSNSQSSATVQPNVHNSNVANVYPSQPACQFNQNQQCNNELSNSHLFPTMQKKRDYHGNSTNAFASKPVSVVKELQSLGNGGNIRRTTHDSNVASTYVQPVQHWNNGMLYTSSTFKPNEHASVDANIGASPADVYKQTHPFNGSSSAYSVTTLLKHDSGITNVPVTRPPQLISGTAYDNGMYPSNPVAAKRIRTQPNTSDHIVAPVGSGNKPRFAGAPSSSSHPVAVQHNNHNFNAPREYAAYLSRSSGITTQTGNPLERQFLYLRKVFGKLTADRNQLRTEVSDWKKIGSRNVFGCYPNFSSTSCLTALLSSSIEDEITRENVRRTMRNYFIEEHSTPIRDKSGYISSAGIRVVKSKTVPSTSKVLYVCFEQKCEEMEAKLNEKSARETMSIMQLKLKCKDLETKLKEKNATVASLIDGCPGIAIEEFCCDTVREMKDNLKDLMEKQFSCCICDEMLIEATVTNCNHIFCSYCLCQWKTRSKECPLCRAVITRESRVPAVIDEIITNLTKLVSDRSYAERIQLLDNREYAVRNIPPNSDPACF